MFINHSDGRSFKVTFSSHFVKNSVGREVRETTCKFATVDDAKTGRDKYETVATGVARQNSKDRDSRSVGQRVALGRAIQGFPKNERASLWLQYDPNMQIDREAVVSA
jgi:hypothetical protein